MENGVVSGADAAARPEKTARLLRHVGAWAVPVALLIVWEIAARAGWLRVRVLPAPSNILIALSATIQDGSLLRNVAISTRRAIEGLAIGGGLGLVLGVATGAFRIAETLFDSTVQMLRNIPNLAIIPMVILWFGIGEEAKIFLVAVGVLFPIYLNTFHGIRTFDQGLIEMARIYGLGPAALFWRVIFPSALPSILVGLRYALGIMWLTLIVAKPVSASSGIGFMTMNAASSCRPTWSFSASSS